ncbi:hypothetical protein ACTFIU_007814 [Dictyostelium citrinum]
MSHKSFTHKIISKQPQHKIIDNYISINENLLTDNSLIHIYFYGIQQKISNNCSAPSTGGRQFISLENNFINQHKLNVTLPQDNSAILFTVVGQSTLKCISNFIQLKSSKLLASQLAQPFHKVLPR